MDIHILRDGTQIGPFTEDAVQSLLKQGSVQINDLAWRPGMPQWVPLVNLLYPGTTPPPPPTMVAPPPPPPAEVPPVEAPDVAIPVAAAPAAPPGEPATEKQKAFLSYMGVAFAPDVTREAASFIVNDTMENPKNPVRLAQWNLDRLKLYPQLFAAEVLARKENRSQRFLEISQGAGAEFFNKVTKAHCQVLVGYLDVKHPNWDADEREATWNYFFPAIAEKFPQLLTHAAKGKFKYPEGPKVAAELSSPVKVKARPAKSRPLALLKGVFFGVAILGILWLVKTKVIDVQGHESGNPVAGKPASPAPARSGPAEERSAAAKPAALPPSEAPAPVAEKTPDAGPPAGEMAAATNPASPAAAPNTGSPAGAPAPSMAPATGNSISLFGTELTPAAAAPATAAAPSNLPPATPLRTTLLLTKAVEIPNAFGKVTLKPGTPVKLIQVSGASIKVQYLNDIVTIPTSSTDFGTDPATPPAAPVAQ
ncbi:MAG: hypothetical protein QOE70_15 [Chthoniobacter sp.]|jgi:hypothetical protein|nr:hypothetical protein [Chthoniobacter sp.]